MIAIATKLLVKKEYIKPLFSLALVGSVLVLSLMTFLGNTLGWFASNDNVSGNGMQVSVSGVPDTVLYLMVDDVRVDDNATDIFENLVPGQKVSFQLYVKNKTNKQIDFKLYMEAPTAEQDTVFVADDLYHYFGSQIRVNSVKNGDNNLLTLSGADCYLLPLDEELYEDGLQPTAIETEYNFSALEDRAMIPVIQIDAEGELVLDFELEFVDNNTLQNAYINFGKIDSQTLARTLMCEVYYSE